MKKHIQPSKKRPPNILTFDIEDWFHILDLPGENPIQKWNDYESRIERNTLRILDLLDRKNVKATFFILGWIACKYSELVLEIHNRGHETASHGYWHQLVTSMSRQEFRRDLMDSREILRAITGEYPVSYRCPGFSITRQNDWALEEISSCGFLYDASIYPGKHGHGGHPAFGPDIVRMEFKKTGKKLIEFPVSVARILGKEMCFSGGGYLRLLPLSLIKNKMTAYNKAGKPVMVYLHPREFDPEGPQLAMPFKRRFRCYFNVESAEKKLLRLMDDFRFVRLRDYSHNQNNNHHDFKKVIL